MFGSEKQLHKSVIMIFISERIQINMKNTSIIKKTVALIFLLSFLVCFLTSCFFEGENAKELVGVEDLTEAEALNKQLIEERIDDFYRNVKTGNFDFMRMDFVPWIRAGLQVVSYGSIIICENDFIELFAPMAYRTLLGQGVQVMYDDFEKVECESIVISGNKAKVIVRLETAYGDIKYHKVRLKYHDYDWFLAYYPVTRYAFGSGI